MTIDLKKIGYRKVNEGDIDLIFNWSNEAETRKQSFYSDNISFDDHIVWFNKKIKSSRDMLYIPMFDKIPIGLVRIDGIPDDPTIGVLLDKNYRGFGLSSRILKDVSAEYFFKYSNPITAYIKDSNLASIKAFEKAGFVFSGEKMINNCKSLVYKLYRKVN